MLIILSTCQSKLLCNHHGYHSKFLGDQKSPSTRREIAKQLLATLSVWALLTLLSLVPSRGWNSDLALLCYIFLVIFFVLTSLLCGVFTTTKVLFRSVFVVMSHATFPIVAVYFRKLLRSLYSCHS
jgi:hypothetical protein